MKLLLKPFNNLIKFLRKNLLLSLFVIFLLLFGFFQLSIGIFSSSDFTMTNTELVLGNIQMKQDITYSQQSSGTFNPSYIACGSTYCYFKNDFATANQYCISYKSSNGVLSYSGSYGSNSQYYWVGYWAIGVTNSKLTSVTCYNSIPTNNGYFTTGNLVQTNPTTTIEQYDTLSLDYNQTLNGGSITPFLIVNGVEQSLTNKVLTGSFPVGTNVSVKFSFTGSISVTPQLNNNIVLSGSYTAPVVANSNSNVVTTSKNNVLSILSAVPSKSQVQTLQTTNKFINFINSFFSSIRRFLGF